MQLLLYLQREKRGRREDRSGKERGFRRHCLVACGCWLRAAARWAAGFAGAVENRRERERRREKEETGKEKRDEGGEETERDKDG